MDIKLSIDTAGIDRAQKWLTQLQGQMPYAASRALNDTAKQAAAALNASTPKYFDRPTRFTQNGYSVSTYSNKRNLEAVVSPRPSWMSFLFRKI